MRDPSRRHHLRGIAALARSRLFILSAAVTLVLVSANVAIAVAVASASHPRATNWPDASFRFWPERVWTEVEKAIAALPASRRLESSVLGTVSYRGGPSYPLHLLSFAPRIGGDPRGSRPRAKILLVGSIHGTEPAGGEALLELAARLARDPAELADSSIDIVPIANPWGWVYGYRYTGNGADINRDFASNRTEEARLLRGLIRRNGPYDLVMDLHESKKTGCFLYEYLPPGQGLGEEFVRLVHSMGLPLEGNYQELLWKVDDGVLRMPTAALLWVDLARQLSLDHYTRLHGTRQSYTIETPLDEPIERRVAVHIAAVRDLAMRIAER